MGRAKLPRKSTNIDMTAMCDVAFLLFSFFILATKFKPPEALSVITPSSVSTKIAPEKNVVLVTIDNEGKVYLSRFRRQCGREKDHDRCHQYIKKYWFIRCGKSQFRQYSKCIYRCSIQPVEILPG